MAFSTYTTLTKEELVRELKTDATHGLTQHEAQQRLAKNGPNALKSQQTSVWQIFTRQLKSPFIYILLACAVLTGLLGEFIDALMIVLFVVINTSLSFYQEYQSEQTLKLLRKIIVARARVIRDDKEIIINSRDLVVGDVVIAEAGDLLPADIRLIETTNLTINETILTGESVPIEHSADPMTQQATELFEAQNIAFSGTTVVIGKAVGIVISTGSNTAIGEIAQLTIETESVSSFEKGIGRLSSFILKMVVVTLVGMMTVNLILKGSGHLTELIVFSITLAVGVIPEALPVVTTFALSRGARQLAQNKVVVKRLSAIEDLGSMEVLCSDKTGTLTQNDLSVSNSFLFNNEDPVWWSTLASPYIGEAGQQPNNSFDLALKKHLSDERTAALSSYKFIDEVPFDPERRRNLALIQGPEGPVIIARGAAEEIFQLSPTLHQETIAAMQDWIADEGEQGHRVIGVAYRRATRFDQENLISEEHDLTLAGLVSFHDPLKPSTVSAVKKANALGVAVKIITGDSPEVAGAVGYQIGLVESNHEVITGAQLVALSPEEQLHAVEHKAIFARVSPEQKYKIIELLQKNHEVGFLGEGINDAPALKLANVSLVVDSAADIAREAADIILLEPGLDVIVAGIEQGRSVFANTVKYIKATIASNFGNFFSVAIASFFIPFLPMQPLQILMLNLLSDFPMISIATDNNDSDQLAQPRRYDVRSITVLAIILGFVSTVSDLTIFWLYYRLGEAVLQTNWFISSVVTELLFLFSIRTSRLFFRAVPPSRTVIILSAAALITTLVVPFLAFTENIFGLIKPSPQHILIILIIAIIEFAASELIKIIGYRKKLFT